MLSWLLTNFQNGKTFPLYDSGDLLNHPLSIGHLCKSKNSGRTVVSLKVLESLAHNSRQNGFATRPWLL